MTSHINALDSHLASPAQRVTAPRGPLGVRLTVGAIVVLLAAGGLVWGIPALHGSTPDAAPVAAPPPPPVTVSPPLQRRLASWTTFTGQFSAVDSVDLQAQITGYLTEIHFTDGQIVHKGDLLFVIDPRPFDIQLQQATAQYQTAVATLELANKELVRSSELKRSDFATGETVDQRVQAVRAAQASLEQAKAAIRSAQLNLDFTHITAPFSGRMSMRRVSLGSLISGGPTAAVSTVLSSIVSLDPIHLDFDMSESDYLAYQRFLAAGQAGGKPDRTVDASLSDEDGWQRRGTLEFIDNQVDRSSGTMHARADMANPDLLIAPGQFARLRLPVSAPVPVLLVPDAAVFTDQSRKILMTVGPDGTVVPKMVEIGALEGDLRVITKGLSPTDQVVINGLMRVRPGAKVTPQPGKIVSTVQG
jgi:RND family efflux transporter MFP subunit